MGRDDPPDNFPHCDVCGLEAGSCQCPICPMCGVQGRKECQAEHYLNEVLYPNRDGTRSCWYRVVSTKQPYPKGKWQSGRFHQWTSCHTEYETGPGPWPGAIVEGMGGTVRVISIGDVNFGINKPSERN